MADNIFDQIKKRLQKPEKQADASSQNSVNTPLGDVFGKSSQNASDPASLEKSKKEKTEEILSKIKGLGEETAPEQPKPTNVLGKKPEKIVQEKKPEPKPEPKPEIKKPGIFAEQKLPIEKAPVAHEKKSGLFEFSKNETSKNEKIDSQKTQKSVEQKEIQMFEKTGQNIAGPITVIDKSGGKVVIGEVRNSKAEKKYFDKQGQELELYEKKKETEAMVAHELFDDKVEKQQFRKSESKVMDIAIAAAIVISIIILAVIWFNVFK